MQGGHTLGVSGGFLPGQENKWTQKAEEQQLKKHALNEICEPRVGQLWTP